MRLPNQEKIIVISILTVWSFCLSAQNSCPIIPLPQYEKKQDGEFEISQKVAIVYKDKAIAPLASTLQQNILKLSALPLVVTGGKVGSNTPQIMLEYDKSLEQEGYKLKIQRDKIILSGRSDPGIYNGIQSLLQIIASQHVLDKRGRFTGKIKNLQCREVKDWPQYAWRGLMLDEARHFFGKEKIKALLDRMAFYKLNRFHWHLTDAQGWRVEIKKYPKLALIGGIGTNSNPNAPASFYTQEEIKEIVAYAKERFITIIPEIDMPGHASAANRAYPEFSGGGTGFTFNPGKESTYGFLTQVLREVDALFPSQIIHLGGDEVSHGNKAWPEFQEVQSLMKSKGLQDLKAVENYFFKRMADSLLSFNNKVAGWDEVTGAGLPKDSTILFWWRDSQSGVLENAVKKGYPMVLCPKRPFYFDFTQDSTHKYGVYAGRSINTSENVYNFSLEKLSVKVNPENILGFQANVWTERIITDRRLEFMLFPRMLALAENAWTNRENKNYQSFKSRVRDHNAFLRLNNIYFYDLDIADKHGEPIN